MRAQAHWQVLGGELFLFADTCNVYLLRYGERAVVPAGWQAGPGQRRARVKGKAGCGMSFTVEIPQAGTWSPPKWRAEAGSWARCVALVDVH